MYPGDLLHVIGVDEAEAGLRSDHDPVEDRDKVELKLLARPFGADRGERGC
jgi:hypothetical protein